MNTIKIGRKEYEIKQGDYILFNGACYQFCAGDGRTLKREGWHSWSNLQLPKSAVAKLPIATMRKIERPASDRDIATTKYFF